MKVNTAWAAGLFEGEGSMSLTNTRRYRNPRPRLEIQMTDFDVVRRFKNIIGVGGLSWRKKRKKCKRVLIWSTACKADIKYTLKRLLPYFGLRRRERAKEVLKYTTYINRGWS